MYFYLKDSKCKVCGSDSILVFYALVESSNGHMSKIVDGATCQRCFTNIVLP